MASQYVEAVHLYIVHTPSHHRETNGVRRHDDPTYIPYRRDVLRRLGHFPLKGSLRYLWVGGPSGRAGARPPLSTRRLCPKHRRVRHCHRGAMQLAQRTARLLVELGRCRLGRRDLGGCRGVTWLR